MQKTKQKKRLFNNIRYKNFNWLSNQVNGTHFKRVSTVHNFSSIKS